MQGSYRSARIVETRSLLIPRLRHGIRAVKQENRDLLIHLLADVHGTVNTGAGFLPIDLSRRDLDSHAVTAIAVFDREQITTQHHCNTMKRIAVPRHSLAKSKAQTSHHRGSVLNKKFVGHGDLAGTGRSARIA